VDDGLSVVRDLQKIQAKTVKDTSVLSAEIGPFLEGSLRGFFLVFGAFFDLRHRMSDYKEPLVFERVVR